MYARSPEYKKSFNTLMRSVDHLVLIGHSTHQSYVDNGIVTHNTLTIEAAFLPPNQRDAEKIIAAYPSDLYRFIKNHKPLIVMNGFQLTLLEGKDLYGVDLLIQAVNELKKEIPRAGLLCVIAQVGDRAYFDRIVSQIKSYGIEQDIYFLLDHKELWPLLKMADLFVRPTLSDAGPSISVQEALYFSVPVVASDASRRPAGAVLFKSGDWRDLFEKIKSVCDARGL
jgi:glycosyltransferase involved in cell wall biosynthesis